MASQDVLKKIVRKKDLPSLPQAITQILEAIEDEESSISLVADLVAQDPAIAGRLLKTANSAFYNPAAMPIASIHESITRIGLWEVRNVVASLGVVDAFSTKRFPFDYLDFWKHCLTAGLAAGAVSARSTKVSVTAGRQNPHFIDGLLHDVGIFLLASAMGKRYATVIEKARANELPIHEVELEVLGFTHMDAGAALIAEWGLPEEVVVAAQYHHDPTSAPEEHRTAVQIVHVADWIADHEGHGCDVEGSLGHFQEGAWYDIGIPIEAVPLVIEDFSRAAENSELLLSIAASRD